VKKSFLIEVVAVCTYIFLLCVYYYRPFIEFDSPGFHYNLCMASSHLYGIFALLRMSADLKSKSYGKGTRFCFRIFAAISMSFIMEGMGGLWPKVES